MEEAIFWWADRSGRILNEPCWGWLGGSREEASPAWEGQGGKPQESSEHVGPGVTLCPGPRRQGQEESANAPATGPLPTGPARCSDWWMKKGNLTYRLQAESVLPLLGSWRKRGEADGETEGKEPQPRNGGRGGSAWHWLGRQWDTLRLKLVPAASSRRRQAWAGQAPDSRSLEPQRHEPVRSACWEAREAKSIYRSFGGCLPPASELGLHPSNGGRELWHLSIKPQASRGTQTCPRAPENSSIGESLHTPQSQESLPPRGQASAKAQTGRLMSEPKERSGLLTKSSLASGSKGQAQVLGSHRI